MPDELVGTHQKALAINLDPKIYGTFAEIGAGQETANWFFRVGGSSGTVARTICAYDMTFSDELYGKASRYVSKERLRAMLSSEFSRLETVLGPERADSRFFVTANTVAARSFTRKENCHGWVGIRYQSTPTSIPNEIILHVNLFDESALEQQKSLGILGVNLVYGVFHQISDRSAFLMGLLDELSLKNLEIDYVALNGPDFQGVNTRQLGLELLREELSSLVFISPEGELTQKLDIAYKRPLIFERSRASVPSHLDQKVLAAANDQYLNECNGAEQKYPPLVLSEITILEDKASWDMSALLTQIQECTDQNLPVALSGLQENYRFIEHLRKLTDQPIRLIMGVSSLIKIFEENYYQELDAAALEALGRLLRRNVRLYVYPMASEEIEAHLGASDLELTNWEIAQGARVGLEDVRPISNLHHLYQYMLSTRAAIPL